VIDLARALLREEEISVDSMNEESPSVEDYLKLSFLFDGNLTDPIIQGNKDIYAGLMSELLANDMFGASIEPHKYDYKCYPLSHLKTNHIIFN
jgi:hypothetical protein